MNEQAMTRSATWLSTLFFAPLSLLVLVHLPTLSQDPHLSIPVPSTSSRSTGPTRPTIPCRPLPPARGHRIGPDAMRRRRWCLRARLRYAAAPASGRGDGDG